MSRPIDPTLRHGRITGASDCLEAVRYSRCMHTAYIGRHRLEHDTPAMWHAEYIVKLGGCGARRGDVEVTDRIIWRRDA